MSEFSYHYTSLDTLFKIIETKSLLLTDLAGMNDPDEGKYSPQDFLNDLKSGKETLLKDENSKMFFDILIPYLELKKTDFFKLCKYGKKDPFALAFSDKEDSLLHWERYGDQLKGVCIAFNIDKLSDFGNPFQSIFTIRKVLYKNEDISHRILREIIQTYNTYSIELKRRKGIELDLDTIKKTCLSQFAVQYRSMPYFIKNEYWNEEDEIRLFYDHESWKESEKFLKRISPNKDIVEATSLIYEKTGLKITEYNLFSTIRKCHRLSLESLWDDNLIVEIKLGSYCRQNKKILQQYLKDKGLKNVKITDSKIRIR